MLPVNQVVQGDALEELAKLPENSVQACVTSPPYYSLRDYGVDGQIGLEETPQAYISKLVAVFAEVRRVLRDDGLLWLNIGDSYAGSGKGSGSKDHGKLGKHAIDFLPGKDTSGLPPKNLMMIPARVAIALQDAGWIIRSDIIWHKPSAMPESVKDRPTKSHEHVFMLAKSERYYYDWQAIKEPVDPATIEREKGGYKHAFANQFKGHPTDNRYPDGKMLSVVSSPDGRNCRDVWTIASQPFKDAHFACMPPKLAERCILASTRPGDVVLDPFSGAGTTALVANNLNRKYIGIELNPDYVSMSRRRLVQPSLDFEWTA